MEAGEQMGQGIEEKVARPPGQAVSAGIAVASEAAGDHQVRAGSLIVSRQEIRGDLSAMALVVAVDHHEMGDSRFEKVAIGDLLAAAVAVIPLVPDDRQ